ncbi:MAG: hypothetical protein MHM6MM_004806 [Cercozoa sp. M6MM]
MPVQQKSKAQKALAAASASRKGKKKKWSKGKLRDQKSNMVVLTPQLHEQIMSQVPKMSVITVAALSEKYQISGSVARRVIRVLNEAGEIKMIASHNKQVIATRN